MDFADRLSEALHAAEQGTITGVPRLAGWRFDLSDGRQLNLGINDNSFAGVYAPAASRTGLSGGLYLIWDDGKISLTNLERRTLDDFGSLLGVWRSAAYEDSQAAPLLDPRPAPEVQAYDERVAALFSEGSEPLFRLLRAADQAIRAYGVELLDAGFGVSTGRRVVRNSKGVDVAWDQTMCSFWLSADSIYSNRYARRAMAPESEIERIIVDVGETSRLLKAPATLASGRMIVLLPPRLAESFVNTFLVRNASGSLVANGQSAWDRSDFERRKGIASPGFTMTVDSSRPYEPATEAASAEGTPGGVQPIVDQGRLVTPIVDAKYSRVLGFPVTPPGGSYFTHQRLGVFGDLVAGTPNGVIVYSVLGMHTQDASSGNYSLTADRAVALRDGRPLGRVKAIVAGNFFENLQDDTTVFGVDPPEPNPGLSIFTSVTVE